MTPETLKEALANHTLWLNTYGKEGNRAYLTGDNLAGVSLEGADLRNANLVRANLHGANLAGANLEGAKLHSTNLYGANLEGVNLRGADLWGTTGNMKEIKSLHIDTYSIAYTADRLQISSENHSIEEWKGFSDEDIEDMNYSALEWWKKYRYPIFKTIELSPATPTGYEEKEQ